MCAIEEMLKSTDNLSLIRPCLESLFRTLLSSEKHPDVIEDKRRIIINLISRLPLDNLEDRATQILIGLCRQGGPGSNRVAKALMQRLPPAAVVTKLTSDEFLKAHSSRFRENALQMVLYSLMTFPSTYFDISTCVQKSAEAVNDEKKRVRQAALDVLAVLGQIGSPKFVLDQVFETLKDEAESQRLVAAVKARLSRKQLPSVTSDGNVQYALRIPTPPQAMSNYYFGADIDWITAGIGSVSPISGKRRFDSMQQLYNHSSSDSNRGATDTVRRSTKDLSGFNLGSSADEYGGHGSHKLHDEKNNHVVVATAIPSYHINHSSITGLNRLNLQSQSFPDLTNKTDLKVGPYMKIGPISHINKSSKLPVASRFPSMESNIEARYTSNHSNNAAEQSFYPLSGNRHSVYSSGQSYLYRQNASLPRKYTNIPIRNAFFNGSHGALNMQSSPDDPRPSTNPSEQFQRRFVNSNNSDDTSNGFSTPEKITTTNRYDDRMKPPTDFSRRAIQQTVNLTPVSKASIEHFDKRDLSSPEMNDSPFRKSEPVQIMKNQIADNEVRSSKADTRPHSHASSLTTKSIQDELSSMETHSKSVASAGPSSIEEILTGKSNATSAENLDNLSAVESEAIDTSLEHIQNESNEKLMAAEPKSIDVVDHAEMKTNEIRIESQAAEHLLDSPFNTIEKPCAIDDNDSRSEIDSRSLTSTESSDYPAMRKSTAITLTVPIGEQKIINKPIPKLRPPIITRRNKVMPLKNYPSSARTPAITAPSKKSTELFSDNLRQFDRPREASHNCLNQLESQNWEVTMSGLQDFVRLIRHHPEIVEANIHAYCVPLAKHVKNLRSQVSRSACQASAEFFQTHAKHLETECDDLALQLFNRTADTNKFLRADAPRALAAMCDHLPATKVIQILETRGATHQNAIVRTTTANLCSRIVSRLGCDRVFSMNREHRDKLLLAGAKFLMEGSLDTIEKQCEGFVQTIVETSAIWSGSA